MTDTCTTKKKKPIKYKSIPSLKEGCTPEEKEEFFTLFISRNLEFLDSYIRFVLDNLPLKTTDKTRLYISIATSLLGKQLFKLDKMNARTIAKTLFVDLIKFIDLGEVDG